MLRRLSTSLLAALTTLLVLAGSALAHDGGEGLYGVTDDKVITNAGFILIIFFVLFIFVMSMIQWRLELRKERRKAAAKARTQGAPSGGGW
ncbi:hypothetical protein BH20ACT17_BH20ACT17_11570 [soil metagenome]